MHLGPERKGPVLKALFRTGEAIAVGTTLFVAGAYLEHRRNNGHSEHVPQRIPEQRRPHIGATIGSETVLLDRITSSKPVPTGPPYIALGA